MPEWPKGVDCKSTGAAYGGSNPSRPTVSTRTPRTSVRGVPVFVSPVAPRDCTTMTFDPTSLPPSALRVSGILESLGHSGEVTMLADSARTAAEAAAALGCSVAEIAKSIVFRRRSDDAAVVVITSGDNRVDGAKVAALAGEVGKADADFVREATGYAIGGVSPVAGATRPGDGAVGRLESAAGGRMKSFSFAVAGRTDGGFGRANSVSYCWTSWS